MSEYFIIAAGGTGAMCASAFIYHAAAGLADNLSKYHILLVDKDKESDAMTTCSNLLDNYIAMRDQLGQKEGCFTFPEIVVHKWNFTDEIVDEYCKRNGGNPLNLKELTLKKLLNPDNDFKKNQVLHTMYTTEELEVNLDKGFYGHPNIGAPVFDYVSERFVSPTVTNARGETVENTFMQALISRLRTGKAHVYLMGSLFGGTGATVIPNMALALRDLSDPSVPGNMIGRSNLIMGATMVMPYFRLPDCPPDDVENLGTISPLSNKFAAQTREALQYYHTSDLLSTVMNLLLVGTRELDVTSEIYARGGHQTQHYHMVHMLAAAAACRFFDNNLGGMAAAAAATPVVPMGELLTWKFVPEDPGNKGIYNTLNFTELGLAPEEKKLMSFLRFSVVVAYFMRYKFDKTPDKLKQDVEILGTYKQMKRGNYNLTMKDLDNNTINEYYVEPVKTAGSICRNFIDYLLDVSLSGFDWSTMHKKEHASPDPEVTVGGMSYYKYKVGPLNPGAPAGFNSRWVDLANITALRDLSLSNNPEAVVRNMTLNEILSFPFVDAQRGEHKETRYPNSIAQIYVANTMVKLGLTKGILGGMKNDHRYFCEIYDELLRQCGGLEK